MARAGLSFYTIDTDRYQDKRIKRLKKNCGCAGLAVYDYILCEIYRVQGCVLVWDEDTAFDVAEYLGLKENTVSEIVQYCGVVGLFDKELLSGGIVTSASIQRRYLDMCRRAKRANVAIPEKYAIIREELPKTTEEMPETTEDSQQSKIKKSIIKENNSLSLSLSLSSESKESGGVTAAEREIFLKILFIERNVANPRIEVERFINHYAAQGWCRKDGTHITDKEALCRSWTPENKAPGINPLFHEWWRKVYEASPSNELLTGLRKVEQSWRAGVWRFAIQVTAAALSMARATNIKAPFEVQVKVV